MEVLLYETVALGTALRLFFLQLHEFKVAEWLKDLLDVVFGDREVDVANVEAVERDAVGLGCGTFGVAGLAILFCFSELDDDGNAEQFLAGQLNSLLDRLLILEFDVADAVLTLADTCVEMREVLTLSNVH